MSDKTIAVESIIIIPRNQFYWTYRINEGSEHTIKKEKIFDFLKDYLTKKNFVKLSDFISRFRPFIILVKEDQIIELKKQKIDSEFYKKKIEKEIFDVLNDYHPSEDNTIEEKRKEIEKKLLKNEYTTNIV